MFPVKLKDIHNFEKRNNIGVNVFGVEGKIKVKALSLHYVFQKQIWELTQSHCSLNVVIV